MNIIGKQIKMNTKLAKNSPYYLGYDVVSQFPEIVSRYSFDSLLIITDETVKQLYGEELGNSLKDFNHQVIVIDGHEANKTMSTLNKLCEKLILSNVTKDTILIAFGGGVIGNIVGLAAALLFRGIRFIEMPTTFIAQTDSTLSNKQAVNGRKNKNLYGCYYAPIFIWTDTKYLQSESIRGIKSGLVESIKNGFISDRNFLDYLDKILNGNLKEESNLFDIVYQSVCSKIKIIEDDPSEKKYGIILEYGHTFGHAIETISNGKITHGEGVGIGMLIAARISKMLGLLKQDEIDLHKYFLKDKLNLDTKIPPYILVDNIMNTIQSDNKRTSKGSKYVLLEQIGKVYNPDGDYMVDVDESLIKKGIQNHMKENSAYYSVQLPLSINKSIQKENAIL